MAAIFPTQLPHLESIVRRANEHGIVQIGNYNSPSQHVLSGERTAVEAALRILDDEHLVEAVVIDDRIPMHSKRFWPVVRTFLPALQKVPWQPIRHAYLPNVMGRHLSSPTPGDLIYVRSSQHTGLRSRATITSCLAPRIAPIGCVAFTRRYLRQQRSSTCTISVR